MKALSAFLDDITAVFADAETKGCDLKLPADLVRLFAPAFREAAEAARLMEARILEMEEIARDLDVAVPSRTAPAPAPLPVTSPPASPLVEALCLPGSNICLFPIVPRPVCGRDVGDETGGDAA